MKKKIFLVMSAVLVFGLAIVVYSAVTAADHSATVAACCCCHGDSCPMKAKSADGKETASCCDNCDCCHGDGESCPMMKKDADGKPMKMGDAKDCPMMKKDNASSETATAVKAEGKVSCPMMKKDADGNAVKMDNADSMSGMHMKHHMKTDGTGCDCACCKKATDAVKQDVPAV